MKSNKKRFFCGITGGTASGKTTLCQNIKDMLQTGGGSGSGSGGRSEYGEQYKCREGEGEKYGEREKYGEGERGAKKCVIISQDNYYKAQPEGRDNTKINWDHPDALEWNLLASDLQKLANNEQVCAPEWDFVLHKRKEKCQIIPDVDVYLIEGIFVLNDPKIRELLDLQIFVDVDSDSRLARRIVRDIEQRGRTLESVLYQYQNFVKPGYDNFTLPSKRHADIIVPYTNPNPICENMIVRWINSHQKL